MIGVAGYFAASVRARSSGARACRSVSARRIGEGPFSRSPSTSVRTRRRHQRRRAAHLQGRHRRQARRCAGAQRAGQRVGAAAAAPGTSAAAERVGAPLERVAAANLDHQVGPEHRRPSATGSALREAPARRSSPSRAGRRWPWTPVLAPAAAPSAASHRSGRTHGTAATCQRRRLLDGVAPPASP